MPIRGVGGSLVLLLYVAVAYGRGWPLHLKTYLSSNAHYRLRVEPSDQYGSGGGAYRSVRDGREAWNIRLPFTMWDGVVSDRGTVFGYAYTHGMGGNGVGDGYIVVFAIDASGKVIFKEIAQRKLLVADGNPEPLVRQLIYDEANDRVTIRLWSEEWWIYRVSNAARLASLRPTEWMGDRRILELHDVRLVRGTRLMALQWLRRDMKSAVMFTLIDGAGRPVWKFELPTTGDIEVLRARARLLQVDRPNRFEIVLLSEKKKVSFSVTTTKSGAWKVEEVGRADYPDQSTQRGESKSK